MRLLLGLVLLGCRASDGPGGPASDGPAAPEAGADGPPGSDAARPEGRKVFVYAGGGGHLGVFSLDLDDGSLAAKGVVPAGEDARLFAVEPALPPRRVHVQTQTGDVHSIVTYALDAADGLPRPVDTRVLPAPMVEGVSQMSRHPTAPWLLISATVGAGLEDQLLPVGADGALGEAQPLAREFYAFSWDPSGKYFFGLDMEAIKQFVFEPVAGRLSPNVPAQAEGSAGHVVSSLFHHPQGWVFAVEEQAVGVFAFDGQTGTLQIRGFVGNPTPSEAVYWTSAALHPQGRLVYLLGYLADTRSLILDLFAFDPATGELGFVGRTPGETGPRLRNTGLWAPLLVGDYLLVGGEREDGDQAVLRVYRMDGQDGKLRAVAESLPLEPVGERAVNFLFARDPGGP